DHAGAAGPRVPQLHEAAVAVAPAQVGPRPGQDVRVQVDLEKRCGHRRLLALGGRGHVEDGPTGLASAQLRTAVELLDDRLELLRQIDRAERGVVEEGAALLAVPA